MWIRELRSTIFVTREDPFGCTRLRILLRELRSPVHRRLASPAPDPSVPANAVRQASRLRAGRAHQSWYEPAEHGRRLGTVINNPVSALYCSYRFSPKQFAPPVAPRGTVLAGAILPRGCALVPGARFPDDFV